MKKTLCYSIVFAVFTLHISCETATDCCVPPPDNDKWLLGTWLLYERGHSPGAGYFIEEIDPEPPQTLKLRPDLTVTSNVEALAGFKFYRILDDPHLEGKIIAFFAADPGNDPLDPMDLDHSYSIVTDAGNIKLYFRWCIEGCHLGFKRFENSGE